MTVKYEDESSTPLLEVSAKPAHQECIYKEEREDGTVQNRMDLCSQMQRMAEYPFVFLESSHEQDHVTEGAHINRGHSTEELIQFQMQILSLLLRQVVSKRAAQTLQGGMYQDIDMLRRFSRDRDSGSVIDEITEVIVVPKYDTGDSSSSSDSDYDMASLSPSVRAQLRLYVTRIASMYKGNPFHDFEHATHVTFSAYQLLRRVVARDHSISGTHCAETSCDTDPWKHLPFDLSDCTDGLASDSLAQFAVVFSALIHDADHRGVPNVQLAKEDPDAASKYQHKSIAEQNSVAMAWELLEEDSFRDLRACISPNEQDRKRFRKMLVNVVLATDICDPGLRFSREVKWEKAFSSRNLVQVAEYCQLEERSRKATVVMDLIIQAADISHTMQPFEVYQKWNGRLYREMYSAYLEGRGTKDPSDGWYEGELLFYDKHIIPLAKRVKESGVFGPSGDVLVKNAQHNRDEWERRGLVLFQQMQQDVLGELNIEEAKPKPTWLFGLSFLCCRSRARRVAEKQGSRQEELRDNETEAESDDESTMEVACLRSRAKLS